MSELIVVMLKSVLAAFTNWRGPQNNGQESSFNSAVNDLIAGLSMRLTQNAMYHQIGDKL